MKLWPIAFLNGWLTAPHCWRAYLRHPVRVQHTARWTSLQVVGLVWFFAPRDQDRPDAP